MLYRTSFIRSLISTPFVTCLFTWLLCSLSTQNVNAQSPAASEISAFGPSFVTTQKASQKQARIYIYRPNQASGSLPVNLYINGRYHASLLGGGYTEFCTPATHWNLQSAFNDAGQLHNGKYQPGINLNTPPGQVFFLQIQDSTGGKASVQTVTETQALAQLRETRLQRHTMNRAPLAEECSADLPVHAPVSAVVPSNTVVPPQPPVVQASTLPLLTREYGLKTDTVFEFGKADLRSTGLNAIEDLIHRVRQDYKVIDRIHVLGYSDAIGSAQVNRKLSLARAKAVADRLKERGIKVQKHIQAEGLGDANLVRTHCQNKPTPANKACHAPNRRVAIVVYGVRH